MRRRRYDSRAIDEEIEHHVRERVEKLVAAGMSEADASKEARRRFGSVRKVRRSLERIADRRPGPGSELFRSFLSDLRQGLRTLVNAPGFAIAVILTIGLGVGANTAVFSITDAILFRPLPYEQPDELVALEVYDVETDRSRYIPFSDWRTWERKAPETRGFTMYAHADFARTGGEGAVSISGRAVSRNWLGTLGTRPAMGRSFSVEEEQPGADPVAIVSTRFWRAQLGSDPNVIGSTIELDEQHHTVVGLMGPEFKFPPLLHTDVWVPITSDGSAVRNAVERVEVVVRAPAGLSAELLEQRFNVVGERIHATDPRPAGWAVRTHPFDDFRANTDTKQALWVMAGAVAVLLLIATINATNLLLVQAAARQTDIAVRAALGAPRGRLIRQQVTENLVLVGAGGVAAILVAKVMLEGVVRFLPSEIVFFLVGEITIDHRVFLAALATTSVVGLALALVPAVRATRAARLMPGSPAASVGRGARRVHRGLVVAEVAMSVTLLVAAGLLVSSFLKLMSVDPGYNPSNLLQLSVSLPQHSYPDGAARAEALHRLRDRLASLPDVTSAALANGVPPNTSFSFGVTLIPEGEDPKVVPDPWLPFVDVEPAFFDTLQIPIVAGRGFTEDDRREGTNVVVDRLMARFLYGEQNPIGRRFRLDRDGEPWLTVVGLVEDVKLAGRDDRIGPMDLFYPLPRDSLRGFMSLALRTRDSPAAAMAAIRGAVGDFDRRLPISVLLTAEESLAESVDKPRFFLLMMVVFAVVALGLAAVGTYGVLAFAVRQRDRELGVRAALGADAVRLKAMVLREGMLLTICGIGIGIAGAIALGRVARGLLFEVEPSDPLTLGGVVALMVATSALACWVPARRATQVNPVEVLRSQ